MRHYAEFYHTHSTCTLGASKSVKTSDSQVDDTHIRLAEVFAVIAVLQLSGRLTAKIGFPKPWK